MKIRSFTDLDAWREGHKLVLMIYKITKHFPSEEKFAIINQMRRCDVGYLERRDFNKMADQSTKVSKLLNGLIKFCKK